MLREGDVLDFGPIQMKMVVRKFTPETLDVEMELDPRSSGTPLHTHPNAVELYEVLEGQLDVFIHGEWKTFTQGDKIRVEKNVPHTFRNSNDSVTRILNSHQPALKMAEYFEGLYKIAHSGVTKGEMNFPTILYLSVLMSSFKAEVTPVNPPAPITNLFGFIGKLAGFKI